MKRILLLPAFCFLSIIALAQFTLEPNHFGKEFSQQLGYTGGMRKDGASMTKEFLDFWQSDSVTIEQKTQFIKSINLLQSKACKPFPDYVRFADNFITFIRKGYDYGQYQSYEKALADMIAAGRKVKVTDVSEFLQTMNYLITKGIVAKNQRSYWKTNTVSFLMLYENNKLKIKIDNVDLVGYLSKDSLKIYKTSGVFDPIAKTWEGKGGKIGWERVGYSLDSMSVELNNYNINLTDVNLKADSVVFRNKFYFTEDLLGEIVDKAQNGDNLRKSSFPRFTSYSQDFNIKNIVKNVDYSGGLSVRGRNFIGSGTETKKAEMRITKNDSVSFSAYSQSFAFDPEKVVSDNCEVVLRLGNDSIYHPSLTMRYTIVRRAFEKESESNERRRRNEQKQYDIKENGYLELVRTKEGLSNLNFIDTYHQLSMDFTCLRWVIDKSTIDFSTINSQDTVSEVLFESLDYYTLDKYRAIKKQDLQNPLDVLAGFVAAWSGYPEFYVDDLVKYMNISREQVVQLIYRLTYLGYVTYDESKQYVKIKSETWKFLDAHKGVIDSDVILFYSSVKNAGGITVDEETRTVQQRSLGNDTTSNAKLSLLNFDLKMYGVPFVHLSDSQNVKVYPKNKKLVIQKNRNFIFDGLLQAGQFYMYGSGFKFDYNRFMMDVPQCDSMKIIAQTTEDMGFLDAAGQPRNAIVRNKIEAIHGEFFIDDPQNKSGRVRFKEYPILTSRDETFVYYDNPQIYNGIYERKNFYFKVKPFTLEGINGFSKDNIKFEGTLVTNGIIPDINETLVVQKSDWSLGFEHKTQPSGIPIYNGKATFRNVIDLSNKGLRADGTINYYTTTFNDSYVTLFPEEMEGHSKTMKTEPQVAPVQFPDVLGYENTLRWEVSKDLFRVEKDTTNFVMYGNQASLDGNLIISSTGLYGEGRTFIKNAMLESEKFEYKKDDFNADTSDFLFYTKALSDIDFQGDNVNSKIDFKERRGDFVSNGEASVQTFPKNKYTCTSDRTVWYMDEDNFAFSADEEVLDKLKTINPEENWENWETTFGGGSKFTSIQPGQDGLMFYAPEAVYNYKDYIITAKNVGVVRVADAAIFPKDGNLKIYRDAVMDTLLDSKITANVTSEYYKFYNAKIKIKGKRKYTADAMYDYVNETKEPQQIHFSNIQVVDGATKAVGLIPLDSKFNITRHFSYQGDVTAYATIDSLEYKGAAKLNYDCDTAIQWFKFKSFVSHKAPFIPIDSNLVSINNKVLGSSIMYAESGKVYPAFISKRRASYDEPILNANGYIIYDEETGKYEISSIEKLNEPNLSGNYLSIDKNTCKIEGEGEIIFSSDFSGAFNPNSYGEVLYTPETDTAEFYVSMLLDMPLPNGAYEELAKTIKATSGSLSIDLNNDIYHKALKQYLDTAEYSKFMTNISFGNSEKFPKQLTTGKIILTEMRFVYYKELKSFVYYGPIGIANAGTNQINKYVSGCIKIEKNRSGDIFEMLLEPDTENWFYYKYTRGTLLVSSSSEKYNEAIVESKEKPIEKYNFGYGGLPDKNKFKKDMDKKFQNENNEY